MRPTPTGGACRNYRARPADPDLADGSVKRIPVADGLYAYIDAADYEWLSQYRWCLFGGKYAARYDKGKMIVMHREIMRRHSTSRVSSLSFSRPSAGSK
jgi:hypothetical protein